jgi:phosphate starvation-inducible PhoH-like protein
MKMFLTRLGFGSKMVVTGDITQVDLPTGASGLQLVSRILEGMDDIHFARLGSEDVVRHSLVGKIVDAYTRYDAERQARSYENHEGANRAERRAGLGRPNQGRAPQDRKPRRDR